MKTKAVMWPETQGRLQPQELDAMGRNLHWSLQESSALQHLHFRLMASGTLRK